MRYSPKFALAIVVLLGPCSSLAYSELAEPPSFDVLLTSEPLVVIATMTGETRKSSKAFPAMDKDNPAYSEEYVHYGFELKESLKGELAKEFEVRQIASDTDQPQYEAGRDILMILSPDVGKDADGSLRTGYLVSFGAHYPVVDDAIAVPSAEGTEARTIQSIRERLAEVAQAVERQYESSPETPEASSVPVVSGELEQLPVEPELPMAQTDRDRGLAPTAQLADSFARDAGSPKEDRAADAVPEKESKPDTESKQVPAWLWLVGIAVLLVVAWLVRKKSGTVE